VVLYRTPKFKVVRVYIYQLENNLVKQMITAILWDYDGTLVNSEQRRFSITTEILEKVVPGRPLPPALHSLEQFNEANIRAHNWRDLYLNYFALTDEQVMLAGPMWSEHQNKSKIPVEIFEGIGAVIRKLGHFPQGICSLNCKEDIKSHLKRYCLQDYFKSIIGYRDVPFTQQKPDPFGFFCCVQNMCLENDDVNFIYIGDHEQDVQFAQNAEQELKKTKSKARVWSLAACYGENDSSTWSVKPDYIAHSVNDILSIVTELCEGNASFPQKD